MSDVKWTPGPWVAQKNSCYWEIEKRDKYGHWDRGIGDLCATSPGDGDSVQQEANAYLAAAGPCMYDALETAIEYIEMHCNDKPGSNAVIQALDYVLGKARGEEQ